MKNFFQSWWQNKKILIIFGGLLAAVGITALVPGAFLRIFPAWFRQIITSLSTELISIGIAVILIDCFSYYQQYQRSIRLLSRFSRTFVQYTTEIYDALNDILFEGNDFFEADLSTIKRLEIFSDKLKEVEGCPDEKKLLAFYRLFLLQVDYLVNFIPYSLNLTDFKNFDEGLDDLFVKAIHLQQVIKKTIDQQVSKGKNNGFAPLDFSEFLCSIVVLNKILAHTPKK